MLSPSFLWRWFDSSYDLFLLPLSLIARIRTCKKKVAASLMLLQFWISLSCFLIVGFPRDFKKLQWIKRTYSDCPPTMITGGMGTGNCFCQVSELSLWWMLLFIGGTWLCPCFFRDGITTNSVALCLGFFHHEEKRCTFLAFSGRHFQSTLYGDAAAVITACFSYPMCICLCLF